MPLQIPGLNWNIRQSLDRLEYLSDVYNEEFLQRLKFVFGHPDWINETSFGIISETDPEGATPGVGDPLVVEANTSVDFTVDISPGIAITKTGVWIELKDYVREIPLVDGTIGVGNVIYLKYILSGASSEINDYDDSVTPYFVRPGALQPGNATGDRVDESAQVAVDTVETYLQLSPDITDNYIPIAIVYVQESVDPNTSAVTIELDIDFTRNTYTFNRPWFSAQDVEHRARLGSGTQTDNNVHALSPNDLTVGVFSPLQLQLDHGMVVADDIAIPKMPGSQCLNEFQEAEIKIDLLGSKTGYAGAEYVELNHYPVRLGKVWSSTTEEELAAMIVPQTNRIVFPADNHVPGEGIKMYTLKVSACEPPIGVNETSFTTKNPTTDELVIAGGLALEALETTTEGFADAQKFPMRYDMLVDGEGNLIKTPQPIFCCKKLIDITSTDDFTIDMYGPGQLMVGLVGASGAGTLDLEIEISGTAVDGTALSSTFNFDGTWAPPSLPLSSTSVKMSEEVFASAAELTIVTATDVGSDAAIMVWVALTPYNTYDQLKDACLISSIKWDGLRIEEIRDRRIIETKALDINKFNTGYESMQMLMNAFAGGNSTVYVEDMRRPQYHNQILPKNIAASVEAGAPYLNLNKLMMGYQSNYTTRALPVAPGAGVDWRVLINPLGNYVTVPLDTPTPPRLYYYITGSGWADVSMIPVTGMAGMYKTLDPLPAVPTRVKVSYLAASEVFGMVIFG